MALSALTFSAQASKNKGQSKLPIINGAATELPIPVYPDVAKAACAAGLVEIELATDENGKVIVAEAISGHKLLIEPALAAARNAKFRVREGVPVVGKLVYNFDGMMTRACEDRFSVISLGLLNATAKTLPMPQFANVSHVKGLDEVKVRVKLDLQKGEVLEAGIYSGGNPLVNTAVLRAAKGAKFAPVLPELPEVRGDGIITYTRDDFNKPAVYNKNPRRFLIITKGELNSRAKTLVKPRGIRSANEFIAGQVVVAVLVPVTGGDVIAAHAISGPEELRSVSEKAAMGVKFATAHIDGDGSQVYVKGIIVYTFRKNGKVE
jgi:hypothetical protein